MQTISTKLSDDLCMRLDSLVQETERNRSYFIKKAIELYLEEKEDYLIAIARLANAAKKNAISLEELIAKYDLDN